MRTPFIFMLLLLLGPAYWFISKNCCNPVETPQKSSEISTMYSLPAISTPLRFECSDDKPDPQVRWTRFRDSLVSSLKDNEILQIKGFNYDTESNSTSGKTLGMARALSVRKLFSLKDDRIRILDGKAGKDCRKEEMNRLIAFSALRNTASVKEIDDRTLIYFPTNSTNKLANNDVESYLDEVAIRVKRTGEKVYLSGHTDNEGDPESNLRLGQRRADVIKNYLVSKGVSTGNIITSSKGETNPRADNGTASGKAENRRTELQIK